MDESRRIWEFDREKRLFETVSDKNVAVEPTTWTDVPLVSRLL